MKEGQEKYNKIRNARKELIEIMDKYDDDLVALDNMMHHFLCRTSEDVIEEALDWRDKKEVK